MAKEKTDLKPQQDTSQKTPALLRPQDVSTLRSQSSLILAAASSLTITSDADMEASADVLHKVKEIEKVIVDRKEEITRPLMAGLASARELFKPFEIVVADAKKMVKEKQLAFIKAEDERREKERERIATQVDRGNMREDTAAKKLDVLGETKTSAQGSIGSVQTRTMTKVRVIDNAVIPREYLVPDMAKITAAVLQEGKEIPGVEKYTEKIMVSR